MTLKQTLLLTGLVVLGLSPLAARADTIHDDGSTYTLNYTTAGPDLYNVSLTVDASGYNDGDALDPNYLQSVALDLNGTQDVSKVTVTSAPPGFDTFDPGDKGVNNGGCAASGKGFFCIQYTTGEGAAAGASGDSYTFVFQVTGPIDFGAGADTVEANYNYTTTNAKTGKVTNHNGELASDAITLTAPTPEPSSLALLGTSVLGAAALLRRRFKA